VFLGVIYAGRSPKNKKSFDYSGVGRVFFRDRMFKEKKGGLGESRRKSSEVKGERYVIFVHHWNEDLA